MNSSRAAEAGYCPYLGVDLTSRYGSEVRAIDVCGLLPEPGGGLRASFWHWTWDPPAEPLALADILAEIRQARSVMVDGPQALAGRGRRVRASERLCRTAGKTPDRLPPPDLPYAGFIRSSVEWFHALHATGVAVSPPTGVGGVCEYYPGEGWLRLGQRRLPNKRSAVGRKVRADLLRRYGVRLPRGHQLSHDALDAGLGALLAASADDAVPGLAAQALGMPLQHGRDGLREGPIQVPILRPCPIKSIKYWR